MTISLKEKERLAKGAALAAVLTSSLLALIKFWGWFATDSVTLLGSLVDSVLDITSAVIILFAIRYAHQPADDDHRFGHSKAEPIAAFVQAAFVIGSAILLLIESSHRILNPVAVTESGIGVVVMIISTLMTTGLVAYQRVAMRKTDSTALEANNLQYLSDILLNIASLGALALVYMFGWYDLDAAMGALIGIYLVFAAVSIARDALDMLMDKELDEETRQQIIDLVFAHPSVTGIRELRTRSAGTRIFIYLDIEMFGYLTLNQAHDIAEAVTHQVHKHLPHAEILVHQEPEGAHGEDSLKRPIYDHE